MYVSIKNRILTPSGRKSRVCVNALDRLLPPEQRTNFLCIFQLFPSRPYSLNSSPLQLLVSTATPRLSAFRCPRSKAGRGVTFLILARAKRWRWLVLREFAKYAFFGLTRQNPVFERSVLVYVSIKNRILTPSGQKIRVCVNALDRLLPPEQRTNFFSCLSLSRRLRLGLSAQNQRHIGRRTLKPAKPLPYTLGWLLHMARQQTRIQPLGGVQSLRNGGQIAIGL